MTQIRVIGAKRTLMGCFALFGVSEDISSFEKYLLDFEVNLLQKLRARLRQVVFLGNFKVEKPEYDFEDYFLFWCKDHKRYIVTYRQGYNRRLECPDCGDKFLLSVKNNTPNTVGNKKEIKLKLVKSDRDLKS